ncbi:hypothetical protein Ancab_033176, partial [Ancistrocladus abbreviatus]
MEILAGCPTEEEVVVQYFKDEGAVSQNDYNQNADNLVDMRRYKIDDYVEWRPDVQGDQFDDMVEREIRNKHGGPVIAKIVTCSNFSSYDGYGTSAKGISYWEYQNSSGQDWGPNRGFGKVVK